MPPSPYIEGLRRLVGTRLLLLPSVAASSVNERGELLLQEKANEPRSGVTCRSTLGQKSGGHDRVILYRQGTRVL